MIQFNMIQCHIQASLPHNSVQYDSVPHKSFSTTQFRVIIRFSVTIRLQYQAIQSRTQVLVSHSSVPLTCFRSKQFNDTHCRTTHFSAVYFTYFSFYHVSEAIKCRTAGVPYITEHPVPNKPSAILLFFNKFHTRLMSFWNLILSPILWQLKSVFCRKTRTQNQRVFPSSVSAPSRSACTHCTGDSNTWAGIF